MKTEPSGGFLIAAPHSGSGKTTITLGLLRALTEAGIAVAPAKAGPDYIDPAFHTLAAGRPCVNLDPWAMRPKLIQKLAAEQHEQGLLVVEAMMGLFDGAADGTGSAADLARQLGLPIVLVVDAAKQSHSIAALVQGFRDHRKDITVAAVILNRVGSPRHEMMLREALAGIGMPVIGVVPRDEKLALPSRHLGLVQAQERGDIAAFVAHAAQVMASHIDLDSLKGGVGGRFDKFVTEPIPPLGQRIAIARDTAFAFCYEHQIREWRAQGAEIGFFSPLADEAPNKNCDSVFLPGGYPELHAEKLAANSLFLRGLRDAATRGAFIYGECGGYMVLGEQLVDADGQSHQMAGLLPLETSFAARKMHLGYRVATAKGALPFVPKGGKIAAHEFHYSTAIREDSHITGVERLFDVTDARGENLGACGLRRGNVAGSYIHMIDIREDDWSA